MGRCWNDPNIRFVFLSGWPLKTWTHLLSTLASDSVAIIQHSSLASSFQSELSNLNTWINEIMSGTFHHQVRLLFLLF
jgi:hypothetical protein